MGRTLPEFISKIPNDSSEILPFAADQIKQVEILMSANVYKIHYIAIIFRNK